MRLEEVSREQIQLLAAIFHHPPSESLISYGKRISGIFPRLDSALSRPDFLHRLIQLPQSFYTPLCGMHRSLNAKAVHAAFVLVATEVGVRLNSLVVAGRDKVGHETWDCSILNLRSLHGAWLSPDLVEKTFGTSLKVPRGGHTTTDYTIKWLKEEDGCEACILSRIGGDINTVFDLHMAVSARTPRRHPRKHRVPRLLRLCEAWLSMWQPYFGPDQWKAKLQWNEMRAARLKGVKKDIARKAREAKKLKQTPISRSRSSASTRRPSKETIQVYLSPPIDHDDFQSPSQSQSQSHDSDNEDEFDVEHTAHDAENEVIDCYAALISTPFLPGMGNKEHETRARILSSYPLLQPQGLSNPPHPDAGSDRMPTRSQTVKHRRPSNYSASVYSEHEHQQEHEPSNLLLPSTTYSPPRRQWAGTNSKPLTRSQAVSSHHATDRSWITASITPTEPRSQSINRRKRSSPTHRFHTPISPISETYGRDPSTNPHTHQNPYTHHDIDHDGYRTPSHQRHQPRLPTPPTPTHLDRQLRSAAPSPVPQRGTTFTDIWRGLGLPLTAEVDEGDERYRALNQWGYRDGDGTRDGNGSGKRRRR